MTKELEALKRIRQETCPATYMDDFDKNECCDVIEQALLRLESIDNANPSEALECLEKLKSMEISSMPFSDEYGTQEVDLNDIRKVGSQLNTDFREYTTTIKQALLKAQKEHNSVNLLMQELDCKDFAELRKYARCGYEKINKHYLKWEDLEFKEMYKIIPVRMGDNVYQMAYCLYENEGYIRLEDCQRIYLELFANEKKFFNDLHLEVVE